MHKTLNFHQCLEIYLGVSLPPQDLLKWLLLVISKTGANYDFNNYLVLNKCTNLFDFLFLFVL